MGVTGLWRLIEPAGKPVPVETLENKVLAVGEITDVFPINLFDISIWLHQMVKGYQDAKGAPLPNAHLMGLFQRLCKLLYFRIKPVFVFDGVYPELKKETIAKRQDSKAKYNSESERIKRELALLLSKKTAVNSLLGKQISPSKQQASSSTNADDLFKLPALPQREEESESESEDERSSSCSSVDLHSVDVESDSFKNLPAKEKYDILLDLKETRKQNSWGRLQELPKKSDNFSDFQMQRLLKRRKVQECLEETEKEMGDVGMSLNDLECLLNEEGIDTKIDSLPTKRIASNVTSRYLLIKDIKQALADAKKKEEKEIKPGPSSVTIKEITETEKKPEKVDELEDDLQKAIKMSLECVDEPNVNVSKTDDSWTSCMTDTDSEYSGTDSEEDDGFEQPNMSCAKSYIMQYSDFTIRAVDELVSEKRKGKNKHKLPKVDEIIDEVNKADSVILDRVQISSSDEDDCIQKETFSQNGEVNDESSSNLLHSLSKDCEKLDNSLDATQASVVCIENHVPDIIDVDTSTELTDDNEKQSEVEIKKELDLSDNEFEEVASIESKEDSSDSDFEEVPDIVTKVNKPIVELILNVGDAPDDDIFADVFTEKKNTVHQNTTIVAQNIESIEKIDSKSEEVFNDFKIPKTVVKSIQIENIEKKTEIKNRPYVDVTNKNETAHVDATNKNETIDVSKINHNLPKDTVKRTKTGDSVETSQLSIHSITTNELPVEAVNISNKNDNPPKEVISTEALNTMVEEMQDQEQNLLQEKGRLDRVGRNITEQMTKEAQELLQIFGIPYIVAPMEAEAQCAFLESINLTDGTITDDSDIWLFGGRTVYKNFFNQKKHVLQYQAERIEASFNLNREQLVLLALLVGSDYTTGLTGVGPVTALEILASFPFSKRQLLNETTKPAQYAQIIKGLQEFKQWVKAGKRTDNSSLKKKLKNVTLTEDFPSIRVVQAYLEPNIEKSKDKFSWGELDITVLRDYTKAKFGWSQNKLDEIIKPVIKRIVERKAQRSMQDYFKRKIEFQTLDHQMSKRVKAAVQRMDPESSSLGNVELESEKVGEKVKPATKRKAAKSGPKSKAGPSAPKQKKNDEDHVLLNQGVKIVTLVKDDGKSGFEIKINKTDRVQEIIPQREKDKKSLLENKLKAIELFRKTQLDQKKKTVKRRALKPKEKAELSESDSD